MFKDTGNGHTNFCLNCVILQRKFDIYKDVKEFEIARYKQCLYEIENIIDDVVDDNYLLIREKILDKIEEVRGE